MFTCNRVERRPHNIEWGQVNVWMLSANGKGPLKGNPSDSQQ